MKHGFDDVCWIRVEHRLGLVRSCIRLVVYLYQLYVRPALCCIGPLHSCWCKHEWLAV